MKGIYYKEGVYVLIENTEDHDDCIHSYRFKRTTSHFGGRVTIDTSDRNSAWFRVDGILIKELSVFEIVSSLSLAKIASYLNAIEANGVDAFIKNYKNSVEFVYNEMKELKERTEVNLSSIQDQSVLQSQLSRHNKLQQLLLTVLGLLFCLKTYMSSGLENEKVVSVVQSVMDSIS